MVGAVVGSVVGAAVELLLGIVASVVLSVLSDTSTTGELTVSPEESSFVSVEHIPSNKQKTTKMITPIKQPFFIAISFIYKIKSAQPKLRTKNAASSCCDTVHSYKQAMTTKHTFLHKKYACP